MSGGDLVRRISSTPVEDAAAGLPEPGRRRAWWAAAVQWRNWPLLVKLGMVLVVPVVGALVLGVLRVTADVELAGSYADIERLAAVRGELVPMLSIIQRERSLAVQQPTGGTPQFQQQTQGTDTVISAMDRLVRDTPGLGASATTGYSDLTKALGSLRSLRENVVAGAGSSEVLDGYSIVINEVLAFDRALVGRFPDQELTGLSMALFDLQMAREQVSLQQAIGLVGLRRGELTEIERDLLLQTELRHSDKITDARVVAPRDLWQRYLNTVTGPDVQKQQALVRAARGTGKQVAARGQGKPVMPFTQAEWISAFDTTAGLLSDVARGASSQLRTTSGALGNSVSNRAGTQSVLLLAMVLLAAGIGGVLGRYLLRSVGLLRRTALDVAANRLPAAVAGIRAGKTVTIEPVPLRTTEEFGQLARAFDAVNGQAVRSAAEEAGLRSNLRNIFVNLSRRSQGLVERQLRLMEQLEQKEDDPDQLANLFRLDHLATRMRRNNENLMVLSGMELGRRFTEHVPLPDVLRAAVSEVEQYQRAVVRSAPMARIVGYAAGDLVRSVAELVENATAFSPPNTQVIIISQVNEDGTVLIDILDMGIGMAETELREANQRVAAGGGVDVPISRQMGLFVVGSLTTRHGIKVRLTRREEKDGGLRASVLVPAELVAAPKDLAPAESGPAPRRPEPEQKQELVLAKPGANGVSGRLESAGIYVRLPQFPQASSPASILFAAKKEPEAEVDVQVKVKVKPEEPAESERKEFAWLSSSAAHRKPDPAAPAPPSPFAEQAVEQVIEQADGPGGLPKRVPQAQLQATPVRKGGGARPAPARSATPRDATRARGFLSNYQAGIRQGKNTEGEENT
jgi:signal transduction histidine kinase